MAYSLPLSKPSIGASGLTGYWRLRRPSVSYDKCIKCYLCWLYCPDSTVDINERGDVVIDYKYCKGCGICSNVCPVKAIVMVDE